MKPKLTKERTNELLDISTELRNDYCKQLMAFMSRDDLEAVEQFVISSTALTMFICDYHKLLNLFGSDISLGDFLDKMKSQCLMTIKEGKEE
jgi:hypothetical protein